MKFLNLPPVWLIGFMALSWWLARFWAPLGDRLLWPGWGLIAAGIALMVWSALAFRRARTTIVPHQPPSGLVETGPYRYSRNPIYLADLVILGGWVLALGSPLWLILLVAYHQVLLRFFILPEEAVLTRDLSQPYVDFMARVRRWI